jgi:hypothetical protein
MVNKSVEKSREVLEKLRNFVGKISPQRDVKNEGDSKAQASEMSNRCKTGHPKNLPAQRLQPIG